MGVDEGSARPPASRRRAPSRAPAIAVLLGGALAAGTPGAAGAQEVVGPAAGPASVSTPAPDAASAPAPAPAPWRIGHWTLAPRVTLAAGHNDNLRAQSVDPISSPFLAVQPELAATTVDGDNRREISLRADWTRFTRSAADDTLNAEAATSGVQVLDERTAMAWRAGWQEWHDALGLATPAQAATTPDRFRAIAAGVIWRHDGGDEGRQRIELEPTLSHKRYLNHRDVTAGADVDTASLVGRWLWQRDARRRAGAELRVIRSRYPTDISVLTNLDWRLMAVLQSDPPSPAAAAPGAAAGTTGTDTGTDTPTPPADEALTGGSLALGLQHRHFDRFRPTYDGLAWDASWQWVALAGSTWSITSSRAAIEAPGEVVDEVVVARLGFSATHDWTAAWHTTLGATHTRNRYVDSPFARDDTVRAIDVAVRRDLTPAWQVALNAGWSRRHSQLAYFDYTRHLFSVVLAGSF